MKRGRGDEAQFGGRTGPSAANNRLLTTANQASATVQYQQMPPSVLRTGTAGTDGIITGPTVQYTTCKFL